MSITFIWGRPLFTVLAGDTVRYNGHKSDSAPLLWESYPQVSSASSKRKRDDDAEAKARVKRAKGSSSKGDAPVNTGTPARSRTPEVTSSDPQQLEVPASPRPRDVIERPARAVVPAIPPVVPPAAAMVLDVPPVVPPAAAVVPDVPPVVPPAGVVPDVAPVLHGSPMPGPSPPIPRSSSIPVTPPPSPGTANGREEPLDPSRSLRTPPPEVPEVGSQARQAGTRVLSTVKVEYTRPNVSIPARSLQKLRRLRPVQNYEMFDQRRRHLVSR